MLIFPRGRRRGGVCGWWWCSGARSAGGSGVVGGGAGGSGSAGGSSRQSGVFRYLGFVALVRWGIVNRHGRGAIMRFRFIKVERWRRW